MIKSVILFSCLLLVVQTKIESVSADTGINISCLSCLCYASSDCDKENARCEDDACGIFKITKPYWMDAGKPVLKGDNPNSKNAYRKCTLDEMCARQTVSNYVNKSPQDCNNDGQIDCYDYASVHLNGAYGDCQGNPLTGDFLKTLTECLSQQ